MFGVKSSLGCDWERYSKFQFLKKLEFAIVPLRFGSASQPPPRTHFAALHEPSSEALARLGELGAALSVAVLLKNGTDCCRAGGRVRPPADGKIEDFLFFQKMKINQTIPRRGSPFGSRNHSRHLAISIAECLP